MIGAKEQGIGRQTGSDQFPFILITACKLELAADAFWQATFETLKWQGHA